MDRIKTFAKYAIWLILFWLLSDALIYYGINSTYKDIKMKSEMPNQISIENAEATKVNGRIKGSVINPEENPINGKYLKFDFYSSRDVLKGTKYIDISGLQQNELQEIEMHFKLEGVSYYTISVVDEKTEKEIELLPQDLNKTQIVIATFLALIVL